VLDGRVSSKYLYLLVTGDNVFPFGVWGLNIAVLPATADYNENTFLILEDVEKIVRELGEWYLKGIEEYYRKEKNKAPEKQDVLDFLSWLLKERINYQNKFGKQKPKAYTLVYNRGGDALNMGTAVIDRLQLLNEANKFIQKALGINDDVQIVSGVVIDYTIT